VRGPVDPADVPSFRTALSGAGTAVLVPLRGNAWQHTHRPVRDLLPMSQWAHVILASSFAVGHGGAHPLNNADPSLLPARIAAERELRARGPPHTIVRPTWLTSVPVGAHAIALSQGSRDRRHGVTGRRGDRHRRRASAMLRRRARAIVRPPTHQPRRLRHRR
jgi:uncharacterized protein YbjT (DUF2867 family)